MATFLDVLKASNAFFTMPPIQILYINTRTLMTEDGKGKQTQIEDEK